MKQGDAIRLALTLARRRGYVITRPELLEHGVHPRQVVALNGAGVLVRLHPGVFAVSARATDPIVRIQAAATYLGPGALASHRSAAWLQGLVSGPGPVPHITVASRSHRRLPGVRVHTSGPVPSLAYQQVRCTVPARTIIDLAPSLTGAELNDVIDRSLTTGLTTLEHLAREAEGYRRGCGMLRGSLTELGHVGAPDASVLEAEMRRLVNRFGLPEPQTQVRVGPDGRYRVDTVWPSQRVVAELYGYAWHHSPEQLAYDSARQRELTLGGWQVLIFTWRDVFHHPARVAQDLRRALPDLAA